jgi:hypothetical protein
VGRGAIVSAERFDAMRLRLLVLAALVTVATAFAPGCATAPVGPSVTVLPAAGSDFDRFRDDDDQCRDRADDRIGIDAQREAARRFARGTAAGAAAGAAVGALIGAAEGQPATGAAWGAGAGAIGGATAGALASARARGDLQTQYDNAYMQCMVAEGHQISGARNAYRRVPPPDWYGY